MSIITVDEIQSRISSTVDQDPTVANISSADYTLRLKYMNRALLEWGEAYDWQALYKEYNTLTSLGSGNVTVALPTDFRKLANQPKITYDGTTTSNFLDVRPQENSQYGSQDRWVNFLGNPFSGYSMIIHAPTLCSGASIFVPYYSSVGSLASPSDIARIPNPEFLVTRCIGYVWETREDARFGQAKAEAQQILANMIELENVFPEGSASSRVKTVEEIQNFRIGRD